MPNQLMESNEKVKGYSSKREYGSGIMLTGREWVEYYFNVSDFNF